MNDDMRTHPVLSGLYWLSLSDIKLLPIDLPNFRLSDYKLKEIRFEYGIGIVEYADGQSSILGVIYDEMSNIYTFDHLGIKYSFQVTASLAGVNPLVDLLTVVDFGQIAKEEGLSCEKSTT